MDHLKRIFQCANPSLHSSTEAAIHSHDVSGIDKTSSESVKEPPPTHNLFQAHYKQQHLASLAENQATFELQKKYIEKRIQYINIQIEKIDQIRKACLNLQNKLSILKGDAEWVKFE